MRKQSKTHQYKSGRFRVSIYARSASIAALPIFPRKSRRNGRKSRVVREEKSKSSRSRDEASHRIIIRKPGSWSLAARFPGKISKLTPDTPGPADYHVRDDRQIGLSGPSASIRSRTKVKGQVMGATTLKKDPWTPGPGSHNPHIMYDSTRASTPAFTIRQRHFRPTSHEATPGPYHYKDPKGTGPSYSLKFRHNLADSELKEKQWEPGPMSYDVNHSFLSTSRSTPALTMPSRKRTVAQTEQVPGPGQYTPKPSALSTQKHAPAFRLASRPPDKVNRLNATPGAGHYNPNHRVVLPAAPQWGMTGRPRSDVSKEQHPAPNQYRCNFDSVLPRTPSAPLSFRYHNDTEYLLESFEAKTRPISSPADVSILSTNRNSPKFSIVPRRSLHLRAPKIDQIPGPGAYNTRILTRSPSAPLGVRRKVIIGCAKPPKVSPGPASYNVTPNLYHEPTAKTISGRGRSSHLNQGSDGPGPAAYNVDDRNLKPRTPAYTIVSRKSPKNAGNASPGPGAHHSVPIEVTQRRSPTFLMGGRPRPHTISSGSISLYSPKCTHTGDQLFGPAPMLSISLPNYSRTQTLPENEQHHLHSTGLAGPSPMYEKSASMKKKNLGDKYRSDEWNDDTPGCVVINPHLLAYGKETQAQQMTQDESDDYSDDYEEEIEEMDLGSYFSKHVSPPAEQNDFGSSTNGELAISPQQMAAAREQKRTSSVLGKRSTSLARNPMTSIGFATPNEFNSTPSTQNKPNSKNNQLDALWPGSNMIRPSSRRAGPAEHKKRIQQTNYAPQGFAGLFAADSSLETPKES